MDVVTAEMTAGSDPTGIEAISPEAMLGRTPEIAADIAMSGRVETVTAEKTGAVAKEEAISSTKIGIMATREEVETNKTGTMGSLIIKALGSSLITMVRKTIIVLVGTCLQNNQITAVAVTMRTN
jgi:hypothetical protein